ncbi:MAG: hypothetical protein IJ593_00160 [Lachnospiraceae bacterium]|nr:hypothetical protein [Lachnospiraceae bacterium]
MKARIKKTGEIVEVVSFSDTSIERSVGDYVSYINSKGKPQRESLNYYLDFQPIPASTDWESLRHQYAGMAMLGVMNFFGSIDYNKETIAKLAVEQANALIEQLKEK